jgi:hypothetical protein
MVIDHEIERALVQQPVGQFLGSGTFDERGVEERDDCAQARLRRHHEWVALKRWSFEI